MLWFAAGRLSVLLGLVAFGPPWSVTVSVRPELVDHWRVAGRMREDRADAAAVVLSDGRVLVTGGYSTERKKYLRSAELWDPRTFASTATGSMTAPRSAHTATLLDDGRVLVVGGEREGPEESGTQDTAELWDPASGKFSKTASMQGARRHHVAVRLADGRVAVGGGGLSTPAVEVWDASSETWRVVDRRYGDDVALAAPPSGGLVEVTRQPSPPALVARRWEGHGDPGSLATLNVRGLKTVFAFDATRFVVITDDELTVWNPTPGETRRASLATLGPDASPCWSRVRLDPAHVMCLSDPSSPVRDVVIDVDEATGAFSNSAARPLRSGFASRTCSRRPQSRT